MIYLINTFNPHWEGHALPEWTWPKRRVFGYMLKLMDGPLSLGIGGLRRIGKTTLLIPEILGRLVENDVFLRLREMDAALTFWRVGRQEIDFMFHVRDAVLPVECKTGRLRSNDTRLIRSVSEKLRAPFSVMVTSDTFDFTDPSILRVPAFML